MAVTVTIAKARAYVGLPPAPTDADLDAVNERLWAAAVAEVERHAPGAPDAVADAAALTLFAYLYGVRGGESGDDGYVRAANPLRKSGALALLRAHVVHRAGAI